MSGAPHDESALKESVHRRLIDELPDRGDREPAQLRDILDELVRAEAPLLAPPRARALLGELLAEVTGLGPLEPILADPEVTEVMLNSGGLAYVERGGRLEPVPIGLEEREVVRLARRVLAPLGLRLDRSSPIVDARLPDGSRIHAVLPPVAPDGAHLTIRRFGRRPSTLAEFGLGSDGAALLTRAVAAGSNVLVAGGTSTGKTTLVNVLAGAIGAHERVVTIEETAELSLPGSHVVRLEARPANAEGVGAVSVRDLVRTSLRMRPDRIIVGEVRGAEALDLILALNTGHAGSLATVHANRGSDALARLETLALMAAVGLPHAAVRAQIGSALDLVLTVARDRSGSRRVVEIVEVAPSGSGVHVLAARRDGRLEVLDQPRRPMRGLGSR